MSKVDKIRETIQQHIININDDIDELTAYATKEDIQTLHNLRAQLENTISAILMDLDGKDLWNNEA